MPSDPADDDDDFVDRWADPESDLAEAEQPFGDPEESAVVPNAPSETDTEIQPAAATELGESLSAVDDELLNAFVVSVLLTKAGVLLVCAGVMVIVLRGWVELGGGLLAVGLFAFLRVGYRYRSHTHDQDSAEPTTGSETAVDDCESQTNTDTEPTNRHNR